MPWKIIPEEETGDLILCYIANLLLAGVSTLLSDNNYIWYVSKVFAKDYPINVNFVCRR